MSNEHPKDDTPIPHWKIVEQAVDEHQQKHRQIRRVLRQTPDDAEGASPGSKDRPVVFVTDSLARTSARLLSGATPKAPASVVYWFGFECGERAVVSTLIVPEKDCHTDAVLASAVANEELFTAIVGASLVFLGQVRLLDEEETPEDARDVRFEGAFLIEIPPALSNGKFQLEKCRIYRQIDGTCRKIKPRELKGHLRVIPGFKDLRPANGSTPMRENF